MPPDHPDIRRLTHADAEQYRHLRLLGLQTHPDSFGAAWEDEAEHAAAWFADRLTRLTVFGATRPGTPGLGAIAGFRVEPGAKLRHKGVLWGMFVHPDYRGTDLGDRLVACILDHARDTVEEVRLTVGASNRAAIRLYERAGFRCYGREPRSLRVGTTYHDELHMALTLRPPAGKTPGTPL